MIKNKIVLLPFPFDDFSSEKMRPVLCLTNPIGPHHHIVVAFITSQISAHPLSTDVILKPEDLGFKKTGLRLPSMIQLHRLMTISTVLIKRELGTLPANLEKVVISTMHLLFEH